MDSLLQNSRELIEGRLYSSIIVFALSCLLIVAGCGDGGQQTQSASSSETTSKQQQNQQQAKLDKKVDGVLRPLTMVDEEYGSAVSDGKVVDKTEYQETEMFVKGVSDAWKKAKPALQGKLSGEEISKLNEKIAQLQNHIKEKKSVSGQEKLVTSISEILHTIRSDEVSEDLKHVVASIRTADQHIQAEKTADQQRVGVTFRSSRPIYKGSKVVSAAGNDNVQLRVLLREVSTKREIPGVSVTASFLDKQGSILSSSKLRETWGPYLFYGANVSVPNGASTLQLTVGPANVGRHADMKTVYKREYTVDFNIEQNQGRWIAKGPDPKPVSKDYDLGQDVAMGLEESLDLKTTGEYRVGFIAEASEPYWKPESSNGTIQFKLARIPDNANRHLEVALFERETNRIVPHAGVNLSVTPNKKGASPAVNTKLPFLLSAFYHYGSSLHLGKGNYRVSAQISKPELHTLEKGKFSQQQSVSFDWKAGEPTGHEDGHGKDHGEEEHAEHGDEA
ncbi:MAG: hypothetical protein ABEJ65_06435 [bacterium]